MEGGKRDMYLAWFEERLSSGVGTLLGGVERLYEKIDISSWRDDQAWIT